jgi:hypothetical protein
MGKTLFWLVVAGMALTFGILLFPSIHSILDETDTTGFSYLLSAMVTGLPYVLLFIIGYIVFKASRGGN